MSRQLSGESHHLKSAKKQFHQWDQAAWQELLHITIVHTRIFQTLGQK